MSLEDDELDLKSEIETLKSIYIKELELEEDESGYKSITLHLFPATADIESQKYVRLSLTLDLPRKYPEIGPDIIIKNTRGLSDEDIERIYRDARLKANEKRGTPMLFEIIEVVKEHLTKGNTPNCDCAICLCNFSQEDVFIKTECYHYFHSHCLAKYVLHCSQKQEVNSHREEGKTAETQNILCPVCRLEISFDSQTPESFPLPQESLSANDFVLTEEMKEAKREMEKIMKKQQSQGGIIDIEAERNKYLLDISSVPEVPLLPSASPTPHKNPSLPEECEENDPNENHTLEHQTEIGGGKEVEETGRKDVVKSERQRIDWSLSQEENSTTEAEHTMKPRYPYPRYDQRQNRNNWGRYRGYNRSREVPYNTHNSLSEKNDHKDLEDNGTSDYDRRWRYNGGRYRETFSEYKKRKNAERADPQREVSGGKEMHKDDAISNKPEDSKRAAVCSEQDGKHYRRNRDRRTDDIHENQNKTDEKTTSHSYKKKGRRPFNRERNQTDGNSDAKDDRRESELSGKQDENDGSDVPKKDLNGNRDIKTEESKKRREPYRRGRRVRNVSQGEMNDNNERSSIKDSQKTAPEYGEVPREETYIAHSKGKSNRNRYQQQRDIEKPADRIVNDENVERSKSSSGDLISIPGAVNAIEKTVENAKTENPSKERKKYRKERNNKPKNQLEGARKQIADEKENVRYSKQVLADGKVLDVPNKQSTYNQAKSDNVELSAYRRNKPKPSNRNRNRLEENRQSKERNNLQKDEKTSNASGTVVEKNKDHIPKDEDREPLSVPDDKSIPNSNRKQSKYKEQIYYKVKPYASGANHNDFSRHRKNSSDFQEENSATNDDKHNATKNTERRRNYDDGPNGGRRPIRDERRYSRNYRRHYPRNDDGVSLKTEEHGRELLEAESDTKVVGSLKKNLHKEDSHPSRNYVKQELPKTNGSSRSGKHFNESTKMAIQSEEGCHGNKSQETRTTSVENEANGFGPFCSTDGDTTKNPASTHRFHPPGFPACPMHVRPPPGFSKIM